VSTPPDFAKARQIIDAAKEKGVTLRLLGGVAFQLRCPSAAHRALQRDYLDLDFAGYSRQSRDIRRFFEGRGYVPREMFNAMQGDRRLIFNDLASQRRADIFLDVFEMCHKIDLRKRLEIDDYTLPLADMLATKLQIVEVNEKDQKDMVSLFIDYEVGETDDGKINGKYIAGLCGSDWGIFKTFTMNLDRLQEAIAGMDLGEEQRSLVRGRVIALHHAIDAAPKSLGWTMRAKVGERKQWYNLPERDVQIVDSRIARGEQKAS
jgi:hypothetical protein